MLPGPLATEDAANVGGAPGAGGSPGAGGETVPGGTGGTPLPTGGPLPLSLDRDPVRFRYVRLTHEQWENSVVDNLRLTEPTGHRDGLSPDAMTEGYGNDERALYVNSALYFDYEAAAEALGSRMASDPARLAAVSGETDPAAFIAEVGRRFYRRTLTDDELARYLDIFNTGTAHAALGEEFAKGASLVVEVMLQAPTFLYRVESADEGEPLSGVEVATKLAYFVTNTTPTDALLDAAEAGDLDTAEGVTAAARTLLETFAATSSLRRFHSETLGLSRVGSIDKGGVPEWDAISNEDLVESASLFFDRLVTDSLGLRDLLLSPVAFVHPSTAPLYGVALTSDGFQAIDLGPGRPGYFAQVPYLASHAQGDVPKPASRGADLNRRVLCAEVPPPPMGVDTTLPPRVSGTTNRERVEVATSGAPCEDCHGTYLNPLGFAFEHFDGLGRLRDSDDGIPIDTTGEYPFVEGSVSFDGAAELMAIIAESQQAHACYGKHLVQFGLARELDEDDRELVDALGTNSLVLAASSKDLVLALVSSETFRARGGAE